MKPIRYLRCVRDVPGSHLRAGDLVEIDSARACPIMSVRYLPCEDERIPELVASGVLVEIDGVVGFPVTHPEPTPSGPGGRPLRLLQ